MFGQVERQPDAPINAHAFGSAWRGSRPQSADGTEGSLDARHRSRRMLGRSVGRSGCVQDEPCARSRAAQPHELTLITPVRCHTGGGLSMHLSVAR